MSKKTALLCIIDDDEAYRFTFIRAIKKSKLPRDIIIFSDGEEAINFFVENADHCERLPDVIFLDINMPVTDGWGFLEEYKKLESKIAKTITIYMVSSSLDSADVGKAKAISVISDYLVKPIAPEILMNIIGDL